MRYVLYLYAAFNDCNVLNLLLLIMNLLDEIRREHSKTQCDKIVDWVGHSQKKFDELFKLYLTGEGNVDQRASWPLSYCVEKHPELFNNKIPALIKKLQSPKIHPAILRNGLRILQFAPIPHEVQGLVMDYCFTVVEKPKIDIAPKVYALYTLSHLAKEYPEIIGEINVLIESQRPFQTAAFTAAAKKVYKTLKM